MHGNRVKCTTVCICCTRFLCVVTAIKIYEWSRNGWFQYIGIQCICECRAKQLENLKQHFKLILMLSKLTLLNVLKTCPKKFENFSWNLKWPEINRIVLVCICVLPLTNKIPQQIHQNWAYVLALACLPLPNQFETLYTNWNS